MPHLHPTAVVSPSALLAHDVVVEPYAIIGENVTIGAGSKICAHAQLLPGTVIGENCVIGNGAIISGDPQSLAFDPSLPSGVLMGNGNRIREHVTIHRSMYAGKNTTLGNNNFLMAVSHLGHDVTLGNDNVIANNVLFAGHVEVGSRCFIGGASVFHQFIRVGDLTMIQGTSGFSMDVPPYTVGANHNTVAGLNIVGMKRAGFDTATRLEVKRAFDLIYRGGMNFSQAIEAARKESWNGAAELLIAFIENRGKKGACPLARTKAGAA